MNIDNAILNQEMLRQSRPIARKGDIDGELPVYASMPTINGEVVASLATCHVNLQPSCAFHTNQQYQSFLREWRHPAPLHCQRRWAKPAPTPSPLYTDRLGINLEHLCDNRQ